MTLAMPPFFLLPLLLPALIGCYWLVTTSTSGRNAAVIAWWFGFGFFTTGTYWIAISMLVDAARFAWMIPFSIFGLSGYLALFFGLLGWGLQAVPVRGVPRAVIFAALWFITEWLRGHMLTGFPWNVLGIAWTFWPAALQTATLWGVPGLGFFTVLLFAMPAAIAEDKRQGIAASFAMFIGWTVMIAAGYWRIAQGPHDDVENVKLRIVQAAIPQDLKWNPARQMEGIRKHIALTHSDGYEGITHVIWPESAVPFSLSPESRLLPMLAEQAPASGALITGALREEGKGKNWKVWNSLFAIASDGSLAAHYDKTKLVPFGEFVPLRDYLPISKITPGSTDFARGPGAVSMAIAGAPDAQGLLCYEAIFADYNARNPRPGWLINITNDAWFGTSTGPYQHLRLVQMRAVEMGVPLIRAANSGISAVVDPYGQIIATLPLNTAGILDAALPKALPDTYYAKTGILPFLCLMHGIVLLAILRNKITIC